VKSERVFPYRKELSGVFGRVDRPRIEVHLKAQTGRWIKVSPYADSGADFTLFPRSVSKLLGLKLRSGRKSLIGGINGPPLVIYVHTVEMKIGRKEFAAKVAFANSDQVPYLLGKIDTLEHFEICFEKARVRFIER